MASRYGHAWVSQFGPSPSGLAAAEWRETLTGIDDEMLRAGFAGDALRGAEWPPSSTRFRALCFDVPTFAHVDHAIGNDGGERDPFLILVHSFIYGWEYRQADFDKARRMRRDAYELAREHVMRGGALPELPAALLATPEPARAPAPLTPEQEAARHAAAEKALADIGSALNTHDGGGAA